MSTTYQPQYVPTTREIRDAFVEEMGSLGGDVPDVYEDGKRLFARAVLSMSTEVRPRDHVRAGVAVRAAGPDLLVHPYTFRQVCSNGAIAAHALETRRIERTPTTEMFGSSYDAAVGLEQFRLAVRECATPQAFETVANEMRSASEMDADLALQLLPALSRMPAGMAAFALPPILRLFGASGDRSAFGLLNAVTAVARDVSDPDVRWRLEELGGTMPARLRPQPAKVGPAASALART